MKLYLCGPMTLNVAPDLNRSAFAEASTSLREAGHEVFNPGENDASLSYDECMRLDLQAVLDADAVVVLPRWIEGVGTRVEVAVSLAIGTPVYTYDDALLMRDLYAADAGRDALRELLDGGAQ